MTRLSRKAERQLDNLTLFYEDKGRDSAIANLSASVFVAMERIGTSPETGLMAPRPYPELAQAGRRWIKQGRYWFNYSLTNPPVILEVHFETADIPRRR